MKRFVSGEGFLDLEVVGGIWRGWIVPVGGSTPDRRKDDGWGIGINERVCFGEGFLDLEVVGGIWRGWIVPVGGSTPDRHKALGDDRG